MSSPFGTIPADHDKPRDKAE